MVPKAVQDVSTLSPVKGHEDAEGTGASLTWPEAERAGTAQLDKRRLRGLLLMYKNTWREGRCRGQTLLCGAQWQDKRQRAQNETKGTQLRVIKNLWGWQILKEVSQRWWGRIFILEDIKNLTGDSAEQAAAGDSALSRWDRVENCQRFLPTSTILWCWAATQNTLAK